MHRAAEVLDRLAAYDAREVEIDGCEYREGLQAVRIAGGVAGNIVPDECVVTVNFRFAPDRHRRRRPSSTSARSSTGSLTVTDSAPGALPGLARPGGPGVPRGDGHDRVGEVRLDRRRGSPRWASRR